MSKKRKKRIILIFSLLFLVWFVSVPRIKITAERVCPIVPRTQEISSSEANIFLKQYVKYKSNGYHKKIPEGYSFDDVNIEKRLPWIVRKWFEANCINPSRFYYVEERLRIILKTADLKRHTENVIGVLSSEITPDMPDEKKDWYLSLIEEQKQMTKVEGVSEKELDIVKNREIEIKNILE